LRFSRIVLVGNTGKADVEVDFVDHLWVVVIEPLRDLGMARVFGVSQDGIDPTYRLGGERGPRDLGQVE